MQKQIIEHSIQFHPPQSGVPATLCSASNAPHGCPSVQVLPIKLLQNPDMSLFTSMDVWFNVPALACAIEGEAVRQQLMGSFLNSVCLSPSRRQQPRPDLPSLPSMIYLELNLDTPLATQAKDSKLTLPEPIKDDSWRLPQTGAMVTGPQKNPIRMAAAMFTAP